MGGCGMNAQVEKTAAVLVEMLKARGLTCATAESCTGGGVSCAITAVAGASDVFQGGAVTYANAAKEAVLGVSSATLVRHGAVSPECAAEMSEGARRLYRADIAVSVTGIAGPGGGSPGKPVGMVWFSVSTSSGTRVEKSFFQGDRASVRAQAVLHALGMLVVAATGP